MAEQKKPDKSEPKRRRRRNDSIADWGSASPELLRRVIECIAKDGGAVRFGYSRDGGAYALGVYGDGKPFTEYLPGTLDVDDWLEELKLDYE